MTAFAFSILQTSVPEKIVRRLKVQNFKRIQMLNRTVPKGRKSAVTERKRENGEKWAVDGRPRAAPDLNESPGIPKSGVR